MKLTAGQKILVLVVIAVNVGLGRRQEIRKKRGSRIARIIHTLQRLANAANDSEGMD